MGENLKNGAFHIEASEVRRRFNQVAASYDRHAFVQREVGQRLLERLDYLRIEPRVVLELGVGTGASLPVLRDKYAQATVVGIDLSAKMLACAQRKNRWFRRPCLVLADALRLPIADNSVDLIFSNLMLPWLNDSDVLYGEIMRVLRKGGTFLFSTLGPDTLNELRAAMRSTGREHVHAFMDMHDIGDALVRNGAQNPVMDVETIKVNYPSLAALIADLRAMGATNLLARRTRGLMRQPSSTAITKQYPQNAQNSGLSATVEVVYGHGWARETATRSSSKGYVIVPLSEIGRRS